MVGRRSRPDPVVSEYVQQRLAALLAETTARRAAPEPDPGDHADRGAVPERGSAGDRGSVTRAGSGPSPVAGWEPLEELPGPAESAGSATAPPEPVARDAVRPEAAGSESAGSEYAGSGPTARDATERTGAAGPSAVPRLAFTRRHLAVVAVLLVVAAVVAGTAVLRARPVALATTTPEPSVGPATPAPSPAGSPTPAPEAIVVHVLGEVRTPGVVELTEGARVQDALAAAGGLTRAAVPGEINLAQRLVDGQQVVVADRAEDSGVRESSGQDPGSSRTGEGGTTGDQLDLNAASEAQLLELPGVGPVTAGHIIAWREENGRFTRVEELQEVTGIGPKTFAQLAPLVRV